MKRLPFLDWMRGIAVVVMIQCHVFNSFLHLDLRRSDAYVLSQFVGGMAAVLFLFLAGVTLAFQMESAARREPRSGRRIVMALKRAGYLFALAALFRLSNWAFSIPLSPWRTMLKVDILNCMALAMAALSLTAFLPGRMRARAAAVGGLAIASVAPIVNFAWMPQPLAAYFQPSFAAFAFFPWSAYLAFGVAAGAVLKLTPAEKMHRLQQWVAMLGIALIFGGQYASNLPYSLYPRSEFWLNSPALILIRTGIALVLLATAYLWTEHLAGPRWSWLQTLGKTSLMAYWVHVVLVYGSLAHPFKKALSIPETAFATAFVTALMLGLAAAKLHLLRAWKGFRAPAPAAAAPERALEDELQPAG